MKQSLQEMIEAKKRQLAHAKPRSHIRIKLHFELRELMLRELRKEVREGRRAA